jgi:hypothetical protein
MVNREYIDNALTIHNLPQHSTLFSSLQLPAAIYNTSRNLFPQ